MFACMLGRPPNSAAWRKAGTHMTDQHMRELRGGNMDIDLATNPADITWKQDPCPWNAVENSATHKCAVKNISICPHFRGIKHPDTVLCAYQNV